jgi:hypothetical protein
MLRMIDYNVNPSFVVTYEPSITLALTNSYGFFSTEYDIYRGIIMDVYEFVEPILSQVRGLEWLDRVVLEPGVIHNIYEGGMSVIINYTDAYVYHQGVLIPRQTARVVRL